MNDLARIDLAKLRATGIPFGDLPECPPQKNGYKLFALITNDNALEFAVAIDNPEDYNVYRGKTRRLGDHGSWIFRTMKLFFVPEDPPQPETTQ